MFGGLDTINGGEQPVNKWIWGDAPALSGCGVAVAFVEAGGAGEIGDVQVLAPAGIGGVATGVEHVDLDGGQFGGQRPRNTS